MKRPTLGSKNSITGAEDEPGEHDTQVIQMSFKIMAN
jgi:hypothetical protein